MERLSVKTPESQSTFLSDPILDQFGGVWLGERHLRLAPFPAAIYMSQRNAQHLGARGHCVKLYCYTACR